MDGRALRKAEYTEPTEPNPQRFHELFLPVIFYDTLKYETNMARKCEKMLNI